MKKLLTLKVEESQLKTIQDHAKIKNTTMTDLVLDSLQERMNDRMGMLNAKIESMQKDMQDLQAMHQRMTGKKLQLPKKKYVSIGVSIDRYRRIADMAHAQKISKSKLVNTALDVVFAERPQLTV